MVEKASRTIFVGIGSLNQCINLDAFTTAYLPTIKYCVDYVSSENHVIDVLENYQKQTHRNRTVIFTSNGPLNLIIPVSKKDSPYTKNIRISYKENWQRKHWQAILSAYSNAPYFEHYEVELKSILHQKCDFLFELNHNLFSWICHSLHIHLPSILLNEVKINNFSTHRSMDYFNTSGYRFYPYKQVFSPKLGFQPNMSIIDLLFNKGPESLEYLFFISEKDKSI